MKQVTSYNEVACHVIAYRRPVCVASSLSVNLRSKYSKC